MSRHVFLIDNIIIILVVVILMCLRIMLTISITAGGVWGRNWVVTADLCCCLLACLCVHTHICMCVCVCVCVFVCVACDCWGRCISDWLHWMLGLLCSVLA